MSRIQKSTTHLKHQLPHEGVGAAVFQVTLVGNGGRARVAVGQQTISGPFCRQGPASFMQLTR